MRATAAVPVSVAAAAARSLRSAEEAERGAATVRARRDRRRRQPRASSNASMAPKLKRWGGAGAVAIRDGNSISSSKWRDVGFGGVVLGSRTRGEATRKPRSLNGRAGRSDGGCNASSSVRGGGLWRLMALPALNAFCARQESGPGEALGSVAAGSVAAGSLSGCRQVNYGWKWRDREGEEAFFPAGWNHLREIIAREMRCPRSGCGAGSRTYAALAVAETGLRKGALLEFETEKGKIELAVALNRDGKRNWAVIDQCGNTHIVRPQQVTYLVPIDDMFEPSNIGKFLAKVEKLQDLSLLEVAWEEVLAEKVVHADSLAKILYTEESPVESYAVHRMLSGDQIYFRCKQKGLIPIYEPRSLSQVRELQQKKLADDRERKLLLSYVHAIRQALNCLPNQKPPKTTWHDVDHFHFLTESLKTYALNSRPPPTEKKSAEEVMEALGQGKNADAAIKLLIGMGVYPLHVNVELLKMNNLVQFKTEHIEAAKELCRILPFDPDQGNRVDLTSLKVYTIDSDDTNEIDDGLSAASLPDGRIKIWIHVADPTRWLSEDHILTREAEARGTSIYLPTGTVPMFPIELAAGQMSLQQGQTCCAISVSAVLLEDGSIAEYEVTNSTIRPTYRLSYDNAGELLSMHIEEETELYLLAEATARRIKWRSSQGSNMTFVPEPEIKVKDAESTQPSITVEIKDQSSPAMELVREMMILCGEAVSFLGDENGIFLPYRGHSQVDIPKHVTNIPEGLCRTFAMRRFSGSAELSFTKPIAHASLGLRGYVQFTSPIRRCTDLIAHYQVKAHLRGDAPPFSKGVLESKMAMANIRARDARRLQTFTEQYWMIEYLRRQSRDKKYQALVLRYLKDREVSVLLLEVGFRSSLYLSTVLSSPSVGTEIVVIVVNADPRKGIITLRQC